MTTRINRRAMCVAMLSTGATMVTGMAKAQSTDIRGSVIYAGGKVIPEGQIEIFLEDPAKQADRRIGNQQEHAKSDGGADQIAFSLARPESTSASSTLRVVAHLMRDDGWLLARGSAKVDDGQPLSITLNTVMY